MTAKARYQISTAVNEETYARIQKLRDKGYTVPEIILAGVEKLEKSS